MKLRWFVGVGIAILVCMGVLVVYAVNPFGNENDDISDEGSVAEDTDDITLWREDDESGAESGDTVVQSKDEIIIFHNGTGPMCVAALDFFTEHDLEYTEHLTTDSDFSSVLAEYKSGANGVSEGVSTTFGYYPVIIIGDRAFSGFNAEIEQEIVQELE